MDELLLLKGLVEVVDVGAVVLVEPCEELAAYEVGATGMAGERGEVVDDCQFVLGETNTELLVGAHGFVIGCAGFGFYFHTIYFIY